MEQAFPFRIGFGYDVHQLAEGRDFWLGGIQLAYHKGPLGHSDADVLIHAICDALLGAAALRDIGYHFSNKDERWRGIDSKIILRHCTDLLTKEGFKISNVDATVILELPKVNPHVPAMCQALSECMGITPGQVSIKATTSERLGFVGREEGVQAQAAVLVYRADYKY
jgi:2-C-methyl-D-erythritol 2,4-cyclodiphosphate synthase